MMKSAKIIIFTLFFSLLFGLFTQKTFALAPNSDYLQFEKAISSPDMNLESFTANTFSSLQFSIINQIFGCITCTDLNSRFKTGASGGAVQTLATMISAPYVYQPASGIQYVADLGRRINPVSSAYAQQGIGFSEMQGVMKIWQTFRNISYSLFALIFVFLGFAIMFRVKISPQAAVTLQSALPSIVIALILVTFSYAIVGFMLDITWVINNVILFVFADMFKNLGGIFAPGGGILTAGIGQGTTTTTNAGILLFRMFNITLLPTFLGFLTLTMSLIVIGVIATIGSGGTAAPVAIGIGALILVIFAVVLLIALLRTLWLLIKTYANILLSLIFAPFILLAGAIPGNKAVSGWFMNLVSDLAVLPTVVIMVLTSSYLICATWSDNFGYILSSGASLGVTNLISTITASGTVSQEQQLQVLILVLSGMAILLMTPKAADVIKGFISGKGFDYGTAIGETLGGIGKNPAVQMITTPAQSALKETGAVAVGPIAQGIKEKYAQPLADKFFNSDPGRPPGRS